MKDQVMPKDNWEFDEAVTDVFDDMLQRSIPQYQVMRKACFDVGSRFILPDTDIVDLGCSRGEALSPFVSQYPENTFIGIDVSDPMLKAARKRYADHDNVSISKLDLRTAYPECQASLTMAVLSIQFTPIEYRQGIIQQAYDHTVNGGAFLFIEKILGANAGLDKILVDIYYQMKEANGYTKEDITRKRLSLEGVLVPVTAKWNEELLRMAGFKQVDCFWRWMNFAGWIAIK